MPVNSTLVDDDIPPLTDADAPHGSAGEGNGKGRKSTATELVELARGNCTEFLHSADGRTYATLRHEKHVELHPLKSRTFRQWLARAYFEQQGRAANSQGLADAIGTLEGFATFEGKERVVAVRVGEAQGRLYVDLGRPDWSAVEITSDGWSVVSESPVYFRRPAGMRALPVPEKKGSIDLLRRFITATGDDFLLIAAWLVASLRPGYPFAILALQGQQGSGKSTQAKVLRNLIDPSAAPIRSEPRSPRDVQIAASNSHVTALDNVSKIEPWLSDELCRLATGGGSSTRTLYSDEDETIFDAKRPIILTSITEVATRPDLLERSILVDLPAIEEGNRRTEAEYLASFAEAQPAIMAALYAAASRALRMNHEIKLDRLPRMADFARWSCAAMPALGSSGPVFIRAYGANRERGVELGLESFALTVPLREFMSTRVEWSGTATDLLAKLSDAVDDQTKRSPDWPKKARKVTGDLKRLAPGLRATGIAIDFPRGRAGHDNRRILTIRVAPGIQVASVAPVAPTGEDATVATDATHATHDPGQSDPGWTLDPDADELEVGP